MTEMPERELYPPNPRILDEKLIAFVKARLAEEESAVERAASVAGPDWVHDTGWSESDQPYSLIRSPSGAIVADALTGPDDEETGPFIARYDPARALREVEAGRRILARHSRAEGMAGVCCTWCSDDSDTASLNMPWPCPDVLDLLYRWADHEDYDQKWKLDS